MDRKTSFEAAGRQAFLDRSRRLTAFYRKRKFSRKLRFSPRASNE